ncbi:hypothetical protein L6164_029928 [Bauhinia variegata]|uniref:Uncharacterized protein n=1 Tax=Bauhinia variegata TaxID=167791 RepID=A0ACB9LA64_BAUVA|nr:hypothetical protein L6164_029928 [Bauhinia variegata]
MALSSSLTSKPKFKYEFQFVEMIVKEAFTKLNSRHLHTDGMMKIHDLIRDMGREIVRQISPLEPGKRSRLWFYEDVLEVLTQNTNHQAGYGIRHSRSNSRPDLPKMTVEYCGIHVYKQETNMADIQFHCPVNLSKRPASFSLQHDRPKKLIKGDKDEGKDKLIDNDN